MFDALVEVLMLGGFFDRHYFLHEFLFETSKVTGLHCLIIEYNVLKNVFCGWVSLLYE